MNEFIFFLDNTLNISPFDFGVSLGVLGLLICQELKLPARVWERLKLWPGFGSSVGYAFLITILLLFGVFENGSRFIYFQF